jgi:hypothetical protein
MEQAGKRRVPTFGGYSGEPETTLQGYYRRQEAENAYRRSKCK